MQSSCPSFHIVQIWKNKQYRPSFPHSIRDSEPFATVSSVVQNLSIKTWNCRGLSNSIPYIRQLLFDCDILVLQEHWLWPFQEDLLKDISQEFRFCSVFDSRLNPESQLRKGCGGVCILWKKGLSTSPLSSVTSDRFCGIQVSTPLGITISVIGVYMPSSDVSHEVYVSYLNDIDSLLSSLPTDNPVLVIGDLNCHLGHLGGNRSRDEPNSRGVLWKELLDKHSMFVASLSVLSSGPLHTYTSGGHSSTLDYVLGNAASADLFLSCVTLDDDPLNTSDHLPISVKLIFSPPIIEFKQRKQEI